MEPVEGSDLYSYRLFPIDNKRLRTQTNQYVTHISRHKGSAFMFGWCIYKVIDKVNDRLYVDISQDLDHVRQAVEE